MKNLILQSEYEIKDIIGIGTFGEVKLGVNKKTNENVAIKIIDKEKMINYNNIQRIKREFNIIKSLNHLNIIKTYLIDEDKKKFYIVMEYCERGELFNYILKNKRLKENEAAFFFYQIINGVEYMHNKNIVHRDIKPENLLLNKNNIIKIIDFGLSNFCNNNHLLSTLCGSPSYSSPELINGEKYNGFSADIWSIGISLYAMIYGYLPFRDKNKKNLFKLISDCNIEYPDYSCVSLVAKDLLKKVLIKDPSKRLNLQQIKEHPFYLKGKHIFKKKFPILSRRLEKYNNDEEKKIDINVINNAINLKYVFNNNINEIYNKFKNKNDAKENLTSFIYIKKNDIKNEERRKTINKQKINYNNIKLYQDNTLENKANKSVKKINNIMTNEDRVKTPNKNNLIDHCRIKQLYEMDKTFKYQKKRAISPNIIMNSKKKEKMVNKNFKKIINNNINEIIQNHGCLYEKEKDIGHNNFKIKNKNKNNLNIKKYYSISQTIDTIEGKENYSSYFGNKKKNFKLNELEIQNKINNFKIKDIDDTNDINNNTDNNLNLYSSKIKKKYNIDIILNNKQDNNSIINNNTINTNENNMNNNNINYIKYTYNFRNGKNDINNINDKYRNTCSCKYNNYTYKKKNYIYNNDYKMTINSQKNFSKINQKRDNSPQLYFANNILNLKYFSNKEVINNKRNKDDSLKNKNILINENNNSDNQKKYSYCKSPILCFKKKKICENDNLSNNILKLSQNKKILNNKKLVINSNINNNDYSKSNFSLFFTERTPEDIRYTFSPNEYRKKDPIIFNNNIKERNSNIQKINTKINQKAILSTNLLINRTIDNVAENNLYNNNFRGSVQTPNNNFNTKIIYGSPLSVKNRNHIENEGISFDQNKNIKFSFLKNYKKLIYNVRNKGKLNSPHYSETKSFNLKKQNLNKNISNNISSSLLPEIKIKNEDIESDSLYYNINSNSNNLSLYNNNK